MLVLADTHALTVLYLVVLPSQGLRHKDSYRVIAMNMVLRCIGWGWLITIQISLARQPLLPKEGGGAGARDSTDSINPMLQPSQECIYMSIQTQLQRGRGDLYRAGPNRVAQLTAGIQTGPTQIDH